MAKHDKKEKKMNKKIISYDKENDILFIHKGFSNDEKFKGNIDAGNLVLDISTKGRVKGIEILNASLFLKEFDIRKKALEDLKDADFNASTKPDNIMISLLLKAKQTQKTMKIAVATAK
ncbi:DUF2283 domain-containing protein [Candidatus Woesearchaeota archaeon]|nr:DUF2283 domain-containing protein [Candidatus Woesearchaeota archaeon]